MKKNINRYPKNLFNENENYVEFLNHIKNNDEQNAVIDSFEANEESQIAEQNITQNNLGNEIPSGVSIESASYMENHQETKDDDSSLQTEDQFLENKEEEYTPKLFSDDQINEEDNKKDLKEENVSKELFEQEANEEEDFEIPAFLRKQKF